MKAKELSEYIRKSNIRYILGIIIFACLISTFNTLHANVQSPIFELIVMISTITGLGFLFTGYALREIRKIALYAMRPYGPERGPISIKEYWNEEFVPKFKGRLTFISPLAIFICFISIGAITAIYFGPSQLMEDYLQTKNKEDALALAQLKLEFTKAIALWIAGVFGIFGVVSSLFRQAAYQRDIKMRTTFERFQILREDIVNKLARTLPGCNKTVEQFIVSPPIDLLGQKEWCDQEEVYQFLKLLAMFIADRELRSGYPAYVEHYDDLFRKLIQTLILAAVFRKSRQLLNENPRSGLKKLKTRLFFFSLKPPLEFDFDIKLKKRQKDYSIEIADIEKVKSEIDIWYRNAHFDDRPKKQVSANIEIGSFLCNINPIEVQYTDNE